MKKAVYTIILGNYDALKPPKIVTPGWNYVCFTDAPISVPPWEIQAPAFGVHPEPKKWAAQHKILAYEALKGYDVTLCVDGSVEINCDLDAFVAARFREETPLMLLRHPERACVYDEAEACKAIHKDAAYRIDLQMARYRPRLPPSLGLYATTVVGRRHDASEINRMCEIWWDEVNKGSRRDQLSLPYALLRTGIAASAISELGWHQTFSRTYSGQEPPFYLHKHRR